MDRDRIARIQEALREEGLLGWLLFDFHGVNPIARSVLEMADGPTAPKTTRRWFYLVPARGEPQRVVHRLEPRSLDHLPGESRIYLTWQELDRALADVIGRLLASGSSGPAGAKIAMEYSPLARLPYVSRVDAGTVELVRGAGAEVVSSADLAQRFGGVLPPAAREDHRRTGAILHGVIQGALERARELARSGARLTEVSLQAWIQERFAEAGLVSSDPPTVAVNAHSGDPHFTPAPDHDAPIVPGDFILIDAWAKAARAGAVYADYTQVAFLGPSAPERHREVFAAVRDARDAAIAAVGDALRAGRAIRGCDVDDAARGVIRERGFGERFVHRTGHSIGTEVHANGVHLDNLETRDERRLIEGTLVSVEPGVYLDDFGVRSEVNLLIDGGEAIVTTQPIQRELPALLP
ncbi:MAG: M24 family metallopeptidase [Candidatus Eisenbacteria bacterium]|uniref:M24 family metallopeptidase n=1 Tax=Eiseniibacteriota bacterium TaxID=2212470 RepID=A0A538THS5_UNCEI|nr:MAG: M24 family metallopeptidase [Candidatus Eisenbacteria bacterium]